jgi:SnoaL-like domain
MSTHVHQSLMTRSLLNVFNERDPEQRAVAISEIYSPAVIFYEAEDAVRGPAALNDRVQRLLDDAPGFVFAPVGLPAVNHDLGRQAWTFGPPDAPPVVFGTDIARIVDDRIDALYVFVEPPAA